MLPALQRLLDDNPAGDIHVVASGDPLLHGIGTTLIRLHGADKVRVLPHVSSVTLACARMGWTAQDTEVISLVTAPVHTAVRRGGQAIVLSRNGELACRAGPAAWSKPAAALRNSPSSSSSEAATSGYAAARPTPGRPHRPATSTTSTSSPSATCPTSGSPRPCRTTLFHHDGQITKQTIRAVTLAALAPRPGELLWDVGAGSGSIAIEWCRSAPGCRAVAFEADPQRRERIAANAKAFGVDLDIRERRTGGLRRRRHRPTPSSSAAASPIPACCPACVDRLAAGGRLVANAVTAESEALLVEWYSRLGGELRRFQHYRGEPLGGFTGWRPAMPITQWVVSTL